MTIKSSRKFLIEGKAMIILSFPCDQEHFKTDQPRYHVSAKPRNFIKAKEIVADQPNISRNS